MSNKVKIAFYNFLLLKPYFSTCYSIFYDKWGCLNLLEPHLSE